MFVSRRFLWLIALLGWLTLAPAAGPLAARAESAVRLRNGLIVRGATMKIVSLNQNSFAAAAAGAEAAAFPVVVIDDGLKRTFVYNRGMVAEVSEAPDLARRIPIWQQVSRGSNEVAALGAAISATPFNAYGRRWVTIITPNGPLSILQGITEINARYVQIRGLQTKVSYNWDMRVSTSSLPSEKLREIFENLIPRDDLDRRLDVVSFFIEAERFADARRELKETIRDFPDAEQLPPQLKALTQRQARQILDEALVRRDAGQYSLAMTMLQNFPADGVARVTRIEAQDRLDEMLAHGRRAEQLLKKLAAQIEELPAAQREGLLEWVETMRAEMTPDTLPRLSDYERLGDDASLPLENRVALALGGWLLGSGSGLQNLAIARSLITVRELVGEYLATEDPQRRTAILEELNELEGGQPQYVAQVLALLPPPLPLPEPVSAVEAEAEPAETRVPGYYELTVETSRGPVQYAVQLPLEYHPLRKYPAIVSLHPLGEPSAAQIDWWAGRYDPAMQMRTGQAARQGYVVIAPLWSRSSQTAYEYTPIEHHRVLASLRDAMRRVSIDSDRVYLSGHREGGSAAWDIGLAHPDLWAGLIAIGADAGKYVLHYGPNGKTLPMYFLTGDIAGAPAPLIRNGAVLDGYMAPGYDAMVVLYRGRGDERFYEEINTLFDWMRVSSHRRPPMPREIEAVSMREGDQFFWWLEFPEMLENVAINPILYDQAQRLRAAKVEARVAEGNAIKITQGPAHRYDVYLTPEMGLDISQPITIRSGSRNTTHQFDGGLQVMLEDARQRADRQHVFWDKVSVP
ncbi:carboxylesterase family protein [Candidatus Laterigemmans baculatus]|uniref:carboxylesterase family protein n=1 Tax=Candidatus Laterigemmans baculatus TaxID=2770505 RepID=UPI0013DA2BB5|nr:alpha/beta hydrolase [Candidatus Laterigemmans baculatus]